MTTKPFTRWKSNTFEIQQGEDSHYYWLMRATTREERMPLTLAELKDLKELIEQVLASNEEE